MLMRRACSSPVSGRGPCRLHSRSPSRQSTLAKKRGERTCGVTDVRPRLGIFVDDAVAHASACAPGADADLIGVSDWSEMTAISTSPLRSGGRYSPPMWEGCARPQATRIASSRIAAQAGADGELMRRGLHKLASGAPLTSSLLIPRSFAKPVWIPRPRFSQVVRARS